jgi:hypothetical protein
MKLRMTAAEMGRDEASYGPAGSKHCTDLDGDEALHRLGSG